MYIAYSLSVERYDQERGVFTATNFYANGYDNPLMVDFDDSLNPFDFIPFTHLA